MARCTLCGGKLNMNKICKECGLDNNKTDKKYVINKSSCDKKPLTHVHEEPVARGKGRVSTGKTYSYKTVEKKRKPPVFKVIMIIIGIYVLAGLIGFAINVLPDLIGGMAVPEPEYMTEDYDPYEFVKREIPADGDEFGIVLTQGEYVVGSHIPEGIYTACTMGEYASIMVEDYENEIWLSEWMDEENSQVEDVRLYKGAVLEVLGVSEVVLETDNAQMYTWTYSKNPLDGISAIIRVDEPAIAGEHFRAGVYDIEAKEGYGQLIITIYDEDGSELQWKYLWLDAGSTMEGSYKNLVLPENATIMVDSEINEGLKVSITASERIDQKISDGNYLDYYK